MWQIARRGCYAVMGFDALGVVAYTTGTRPSVMAAIVMVAITMAALVAGDHCSMD